MPSEGDTSRMESPYRWVNDTDYRVVRKRVGDWLSQHDVSAAHVSRWAPFVADLWEEAREIERSISSIDSESETKRLTAIIHSLETLSLDLAEYEGVVKRIWRELTHASWQTPASERKYTESILAGLTSDSDLTGRLAADIFRLRRVAASLSNRLSDRGLLWVTRDRKRRPAVISRLAKEATELESLARSVSSGLAQLAES